MTDPLDALIRSSLEAPTEADDVFAARVLARHYSRERRLRRMIRLVQTAAVLAFCIIFVIVLQAQVTLAPGPIDLSAAAFGFVLLMLCGACVLTLSTASGRATTEV